MQIKHGLYSETLAKIDKLIADKDVSEEMKQNLQKQRDLIESQISATQAQTGLTQAQTGLTQAQTVTEDARKRNLDSQTSLNRHQISKVLTEVRKLGVDKAVAILLHISSILFCATSSESCVLRPRLVSLILSTRMELLTSA